MARTRFEWTMITLSFLGGGWVTWTALDPFATGVSGAPSVGARAATGAGAPQPASRRDGEVASDAPAAQSEVSTDSESAATAPESDSARPPTTAGEQLQLQAVEGWRKLKERASNSKWTKELTKGVEGTAEKWWSGVREAVGAGPGRTAAPTVAPRPATAPSARDAAPESQPASEPTAPAKPDGPDRQIGDRDGQKGSQRPVHWLRKLLQRP